MKISIGLEKNMAVHSSSTVKQEAKAISCLLRLVRLILALQLCVCRTAAETYYYHYRVRSPNLFIVSSDAQCVGMCLTTVTCTAVSVCHSASLVCFLKHDGAIKLMAAASCNTIVFPNIFLVEGVNIPSPIHEWILTSTNNHSTVNTGLVHVPAITVKYVTDKDNLPVTPTLSSFFGNAILDSSYSMTASSLQLDSTQSNSVFFLFKMLASASKITIADAVYEELILTLTYANSKVSLNVSSVSARYLTTNTSAKAFNITCGFWHSFSAIYANSSSQLTVKVLFDAEVVFISQLKITTYSKLSTLSLSSGFTQSGTQRAFSIYCYLVFNVSLSQDDAVNLVQSCTVGKISTSTTTCSPSQYYYNGKYFYPYETSISLWQAFGYCELQNQLLLKLDSDAEFIYLSNKMFTSTNIAESVIHWTSAYGGINDANWTWLTDGSSINRASFPTARYSLDDCCPSPAMCHRMSRTLGFIDTGCNLTYSTTCYCQ